MARPRARGTGQLAETVLVTWAPGGELAGICALRVCVANPGRIYHAFTGVAEAFRGQGHGLALKLGAIERARELGARRLIADTSPHNTAMLALNQRLGYVAVLDVRNLEGPPSSEFRIDLRVRFAETDAMGVAHHAAYLPYLETARVEYLRSLGHPYRELRDRDGIEFAVVGVDLHYHAPLRFDDAFTVTCALAERKRATFQLAYRVELGELLVLAAARATP